MDTQVTEPEMDVDETENIEETEEELKPKNWSPFSERPWPHFPDKSAISRYDAEFIFHASYGINGLVRILNRNQTFTHEIEDFEDADNSPLHPVDDCYLWCALIALSGKLVEHMDEWHPKAVEETEIIRTVYTEKE